MKGNKPRKTSMKKSQTIALAIAYLTAKERIIEAGYAHEIDWQDNRSFKQINESEFLREAAWVVLSSGFRESIVRRVFPAMGIDLLKFQVSSYSALDQIDVGVYISTTRSFQSKIKKEFKQNWDGSLTYEKIVRYLPHFKSAIQVPIYVLGIDI